MSADLVPGGEPLGHRYAVALGLALHPLEPSAGARPRHGVDRAGGHCFATRVRTS